MLIFVLSLVAGLIILTVGGEALVQGASKLARSLGISALIVGLTIVAFGTSAPELAVGITSGLQGEDMLAIGNVVGSNIANVLLVLGLAALARPLQISLNVVRIDAPVMVLACVAFAGSAFMFAEVSRLTGIFFAAGLVAYVIVTYQASGRESQLVQDEYEAAVKRGRARLKYAALILVGLVGLKFGADLIIYGAVGLAEQFGMSRRLIGMTIVAVGTSLPEIATCVVAARRNQPDIAIGNIIGSNIFNVFSVIGITTMVVDGLGIEPTAIRWDFPIMVGAAMLALPVLWTGRKVTRAEGTFMLVLYAGYLVVTILADRSA
jgi:cation:H+ antiporter